MLRRARASFPTASAGDDCASRHLFRGEPRQGVLKGNGRPAVARAADGVRTYDARRDHQLVFRRAGGGPYSSHSRSDALLRLRVDVPDGVHADGPLALRHRTRRRRGETRRPRRSRFSTTCNSATSRTRRRGNGSRRSFRSCRTPTSFQCEPATRRRSRSQPSRPTCRPSA